MSDVILKSSILDKGNLEYLKRIEEEISVFKVVEIPSG